MANVSTKPNKSLSKQGLSQDRSFLFIRGTICPIFPDSLLNKLLITNQSSLFIGTVIGLYVRYVRLESIPQTLEDVTATESQYKEGTYSI